MITDALPPLHVMQVIETGGPGGAETVFVELSAELQMRGHRVHAVTGGPGWLPSTLAERGVTVRIDRSRRSPDVAAIRALVQTIRRERIDIVHAHLFGGAVYAALAGALCGIPVVVTLHGQTDVKEKGTRLLLKRLILRAAASRVVTVSGTLRSDLAPALQLSDAQWIVIPNGVRVVNGGKRRATTATTAANGGAPQLVAIGNIRVPKGYPVLVDAVGLLREKYPDIRLRVAGQPDGGSLATELNAQVDRLGLRANVQFLGFVANPRPLLDDADCFVLASHREGFSLATIEAMLAGVPVVSTRSGGPEEILTDGETGLLVPPADPSALAAGIARIIDSPELSGRLTRHAFEAASTRYGFDTMVDSYESLYYALVRRNLTAR